MKLLRRIFLLFACGAWLVPAARAEIALIRLEHYWVVDIGEQRFGLIEFDTPSTMILAGWWQCDVPLPVWAVVAPVAAVPLLFGIALAVQARRRKFALAV